MLPRSIVRSSEVDGGRNIQLKWTRHHQRSCGWLNLNFLRPWWCYYAPNGTTTFVMVWAMWQYDLVHNTPNTVFPIAELWCFSGSAAMVYRVKNIGIPPHLALRKPDVSKDTIGRYLSGYPETTARLVATAENPIFTLRIPTYHSVLLGPF